MKKLLLILLMLPLLAQAGGKLDSLFLALKTAKHDTTRVNLLISVSSAVRMELKNIDSALYYSKKAEELAQKINFKTGYTGALNLNGKHNIELANYDVALSYFNKALKINTDINFKPGIAANLGNMGNCMLNRGNYSGALDYYFRALKIQNELGQKKSMASTYGNIGVIYHDQKNPDKALEYYKKAYELHKEVGNKRGQAIVLGNMGNIHFDRGEVDKAIGTTLEALAMNTELGNVTGQASTMGNLGIAYMHKKEYSKAETYFKSALEINIKQGNKKGIALDHTNLGRMYFDAGNNARAISEIKKGIALCEELNIPYQLQDGYKVLSEVYEKTGNSSEAFKAFKKYISYRDTILSEENQKASVQKEMQFEFDKKQAADSIAFAKQKEVAQAEMEKQKAELKAKKNQQYAMFGGLVLVIVFAGVMYNRFRITTRQKSIIEQKEKETQSQKQIIEQKHKEITDSINYAERIQRSLLASRDMLSENLGEYFILFKPRDVVSGDFFWAAKTDQDGSQQFLLVTADSTGHGVPGAIMSILNISCLKESLKDGHRSPASLLNHTRKLIIETLKKDGSPEGGKDGMDCSLLSFDPTRKKLTYAAANNSVWIIRNNSLIELKPDKMPVGKHDKEDMPFTENRVDLEKGDVIYTLTDGLPDQFGGPKGKKFKYSNLKQLLLALAHLPLAEQKERIEEAFNSWKGEFEQIDDVTLIGIRI